MIHRYLDQGGCIQQASEVSDRIHRLQRMLQPIDTMMSGEVSCLPQITAPQFGLTKT